MRRKAVFGTARFSEGEILNKLLKTLIFDGQLSLSVLDTTEMVNDAIKIHGLSATAAAALGRTMTVATYMASGLKSDKDRLSITVAGNGPCGKITVCGNGELFMRGSVENGKADLPQRADGKLDVGGLVGKKGRLTVVKSMGLKDPYSGTAELVSGEIAEDFAAYYAYSEQRPTGIALGVKIGKDLSCEGAGGVIVQALPFAEEENLKKADEIVRNLSNVSTLVAELGAEGIMKKFFGADGGFDEYRPQYKCLCSRERTADMLRSLGKAEVEDIIAKEKAIKVGCEFCNAEYVFTKEEAEKLFE